MVYLYNESTGGVFMDSENYDQTTVPGELLGNALDFLIADTTITALVYQNNVVSIELPAVVKLKIVDTPPGIKDATKTNQVKEAVCETGLKTRVPPFIEVDEVVKISTESGQYMGRA
jgi:elongation factor P